MWSRWWMSVSEFQCACRVRDDYRWDYFLFFLNGKVARSPIETAELQVLSDILLAVDQGDLCCSCTVGPFSSFSLCWSWHAVAVFANQLICGITGTAWSWFQKYLTDCTAPPRGLMRLSFTHLVCSVPQGSALGPILFILCIVGLVAIIQNVGLSSHLHADDTHMVLLPHLRTQTCNVSLTTHRHTCVLSPTGCGPTVCNSMITRRWCTQHVFQLCKVRRSIHSWSRHHPQSAILLSTLTRFYPREVQWTWLYRPASICSDNSVPPVSKFQPHSSSLWWLQQTGLLQHCTARSSCPRGLSPTVCATRLILGSSVLSIYDVLISLHWPGA